MDFHEIWFWRILQTITKQCQISFRLDKINNDYMKAYIHFCMYLRHLLLERKVFQTKVVEKTEAYILHSFIIHGLLNTVVVNKKYKGKSLLSLDCIKIRLVLVL